MEKTIKEKVMPKVKHAPTLTIELGREALLMAGGDLLIAYRDGSLQPEIVLAWLDREIRKTPTMALELVHQAAEALDEHNKTIIGES